jgi:hypothetical protein
MMTERGWRQCVRNHLVFLGCDPITAREEARIVMYQPDRDPTGVAVDSYDSIVDCIRDEEQREAPPPTSAGREGDGR